MSLLPLGAKVRWYGLGREAGVCGHGGEEPSKSSGQARARLWVSLPGTLKHPRSGMLLNNHSWLQLMILHSVHPRKGCVDFSALWWTFSPTKQPQGLPWLWAISSDTRFGLAADSQLYWDIPLWESSVPSQNYGLAPGPAIGMRKEL